MKLLIDECIGRGIYLKFAAALDAATPPVEHRHLLDFNGQQGVSDDVWVPKAAAEEWIVITGDSGRSGFGAPLQRILPRFKITAIFFAGKLQQQKAQIKGQALIACLAHLPAIDAAPRGTRFKIIMNASGTFRLTQWPLR